MTTFQISRRRQRGAFIARCQRGAAYQAGATRRQVGDRRRSMLPVDLVRRPLLPTSSVAYPGLGPSSAERVSNEHCSFIAAHRDIPFFRWGSDAVLFKSRGREGLCINVARRFCARLFRTLVEACRLADSACLTLPLHCLLFVHI